MSRPKTSILVVLIAGLAAALASNTATAALVLGTQDFPLPDRCGADLVQPLADELLHAIVLAAAETFSTSPCSDLPEEPDKPPSVQYRDGILPGTAGGCQSNSVSPTNGPGSSTGAIAGTVHNLPDPPLQTPLAREGRPILPTGPPFELLRPPEFLGNVGV